MGKIHLKNKEDFIIWKEFVLGQLSDGTWENSKPLNHWEFWWKADYVIDGTLGVEGTPKKYRYDIVSLMKTRELLQEMKDLIRWARSKYFTKEYSHIATFFIDRDWKILSWKRDMLFKAPKVNVYSIYRNRLAQLGVTADNFNKCVREVWDIEVTDEDVRGCLRDIQKAMSTFL